jgi:hypothetical protein
MFSVTGCVVAGQSAYKSTSTRRSAYAHATSLVYQVAEVGSVDHLVDE